MKLSDLNIGYLEKDGEFNWLGLTAEEYENKKVLTFLSDIKYLEEVEKNKTITCIITTKEITDKLKKKNYGLISCGNPRKSFFELHNRLVDEDFYFKKEENKISSKAILSSKASIGNYNINIEDNVIIEDNVVIYPNVTIKKGSVIRANSTIGGNGFEFSKFDKEILSINFAGKVVIERNVEIQNNTCIDRGVFGTTNIGENVKIDNLVHIGHDVKIGKNTFIVACSLIGGRTRIDENSYLGPNCTIKNGLKIGKNAKISMGSVVTKDVKENELVTGNFAIPHQKFLKILKYLLDKIKE